ncbi:polysaccharide deacetylase [Clostridiales bacterium oral taxon 876 str. F0540]|nr:polysaccharide deacetylase [Clostridiales bacterium oral taxon 876 str. F0540]
MILIMKKTTYIVLFLILLLSLSGCKSSSKTQKNLSPSEVQTGETKASKSTETAEPQNSKLAKDDSSKDIVSKKEPEIYNILGKSNRLTKSETDAMNTWREEIVKMSKANSDRLFINGYTKEKVVALTFDDGPDSKTTPRILDILKKNNIHGSFFFIGNRINQYSSVVKRTYEEGNLVLSHSFSHPELTKKSAKEVKNEFISAENAIYSVIKKKPAIVRPPYGAVNETVLKEASEEDLKLTIWSTDTLDWSQKEKANIVKNVVDNVRPGEIILMHSNEDKATTAEALPEIITKLKEKGYSFVDLSELLNTNAYK